MRHRISGKRLGRSTGHRNALRRNLITDLFQHERIKTTRAKADAVRGAAEKMITMAKRSTKADEAGVVHARRQAAARLNDPDVVKKLFDDIAPALRIDRAGIHASSSLDPEPVMRPKWFYLNSWKSNPAYCRFRRAPMCARRWKLTNRS